MGQEKLSKNIEIFFIQFSPRSEMNESTVTIEEVPLSYLIPIKQCQHHYYCVAAYQESIQALKNIQVMSQGNFRHEEINMVYYQKIPKSFFERVTSFIGFLC